MSLKYFPQSRRNCVQNRALRCIWSAWLTLFPTLVAAGPSATSGALIVNGPRMGNTIRAGLTLENPGGGRLFCLLADGGMLSLGPGEKLEIPVPGKLRPDFFLASKKSLGRFRKDTQRLEIALYRKYGGLALPDTVEGELIYPVGACLLESPEAFKWQRLGSGAARFQLLPRNGNAPLLSVETGDSLLGRSRFENLLKSGRKYHWRVQQEGQRFESWFSLLDERKLPVLSDRLQALATAELADSLLGDNEFGWLVVRVAALCELSLYYEARAAIREESGQAEDESGELRELLVQVRRLQRYGYLIGKP